MNKYLLPNCLLLAMALVYTSCKKDTKTTPNQFDNATPYQIKMSDTLAAKPFVEASLNITESTTGQVVPDDFLGFSFEKQIVTDPSYFNLANTSFINMFRNLGGGLIRIGGATVDRTFFSKNNRNTTRFDSLFTDDVDRYKAFAQAVGWKTIWGLNLGTGNPDNDANEAQYVSNSMGSQIHSFAIGNEPAYFYVSQLRPPSYSYNQYLDEFTSFSSTVKKSVPNIVFSGPENQVSSWGLIFLHDISSQFNMLTIHYYRMGPAGNSSVTMDRLLSFDQGLQQTVSEASSESQIQYLPYRITEANSVYGGGQLNMSNAYASSLWGSEFLFYVAQQGAAGINFHTGGTPQYVYSPISVVNGKSVARPLYYAMLLFHQANIRQFTNNTLTNKTNLNIDTYSFLTKDHKKGVMIINKDTTMDLSITVKTGNMMNKATVYELRGRSLTSLTGTNINGAMVSDNGSYSPNGQAFDLAGKYAAVVARVKAASATLIILD